MEESGEMLLSALIGYLSMHRPKHEQIIRNIFKLMAACQVQENCSELKTALDRIFDEIEKRNKDDFTYAQYR